MRTPRPCPSCGETFQPRKVGSRWTTTCGADACRREAIAAAMRAGGARRAAAAVKHPPRVELTCEVCGYRWKVPPSQAPGRRTCSMRCAGQLKIRERQGAERKGEANPNHRHGRRSGVRDRAGERRWRTVDVSRCAACGGSNRIALHHCVYRQHVRRAGGDEWDPRNALPLCASCHASHHHRGRVLSVDLLPASVFDFARDTLGDAADDYLRRYYAPPGAAAVPRHDEGSST